MKDSSRPYLPAAGHDWLLPLYDPFVKLLGGDAARKQLIDQAALQPEHRVLEIGCGTGTLLMQIKRVHPQVEAVGLDPDPKALARARRKAERAGLSIQFDVCFADDLAYPEASFHRVLSSFMFHHLPADQKKGMLSEVRRVLKPGGQFHMLDFEGPHGAHSFLARLLHASERLKDNDEDRVLTLMAQAGFDDGKKVGRRSMMMGAVAYYSARKLR